MHIDRERFLKLLDQFEGDPGYLLAIVEKSLSLLPTAYADAYIEKYFYDYVWKDSYYVISNKYSSDIYRFPTFSAAEDFLLHTVKMSPQSSRALLVGRVKETMDGYRVQRVNKKETII